MNILLLDDETTKEYLEQLNTLFKLEFIFFIPKNIEEANSIYNANNIDILIVDFISTEKQLFLDKVISNNPMQKTITISGSINCSNENGCEKCITDLNRRRIVKPVELKELYDAIIYFENSQCKYFKSCEEVDILFPKLIKQYHYCDYNSETKTITCEDKGLSYLIQLAEMLKKKKISFELINNQVIIK